MPLINADDLIKAFEALDLMSGEYQESFTNVDGNRSMEIKCAEDIINKAKTIDAEPVKHAHWEIEKTVYARFARCSSCGMHIRIPTTGHKESERFYLYPDEMHYCPHCGAKMKREEQ